MPRNIRGFPSLAPMSAAPASGMARKRHSSIVPAMAEIEMALSHGRCVARMFGSLRLPAGVHQPNVSEAKA